MRHRTMMLITAACLTTPVVPALASDLHIELSGNDTFSRKEVTFSCDDKARALGLPGKEVHVMYINGAGNSLALIQVGGRRLIFSSVISGSGARYAADKYIWSDGGVTRGAFLSSDLNDSNAQTLCTQMK